MESVIEEKRRVVVPRWRDFETTLALGELGSPSATPRVDAREGSLAEQRLDWERNYSLAFATDLIGAGLVLGKTDEIKDAVQFVLSDESGATDAQKRIALKTIDSSYSSEDSDINQIRLASGKEIVSLSRQRVRDHRHSLLRAPRNPIEFVELSREFATLGSIDKAIKAMDVAVALAPANRFVLRSAARLFVHVGEFDKAHHILKRAPSLRTDPWILAAEIAVASLREVSSSSIGLARQKIDDENYHAFDLSELSSALATLEINDANVRRARKLFRKALRKPTENTIAQAEWAARGVDNWAFEVSSYDAPRKFEATAWSLFMNSRLDDALEQGKHWLRDQPFAVPPATFSGMVANLMEDFELGKSIYQFGLRANPENIALRNNLAFALASNDEPDAAALELNRIDRTALNAQEQIIVTATEGLINFRKGRIDEGRALYRRAIQIAEENKEKNYILRGLVFLAREEIHAHTPYVRSSVEAVERESRVVRPWGDVKIMVKRLKDSLSESSSDAATGRK